MARVEVLTDVPGNKVDKIVSDFERAGAQVAKTEQQNGKWTVTATFPDKEG